MVEKGGGEDGDRWERQGGAVRERTHRWICAGLPRTVSSPNRVACPHSRIHLAGPSHTARESSGGSAGIDPEKSLVRTWYGPRGFNGATAKSGCGRVMEEGQTHAEVDIVS